MKKILYIYIKIKKIVSKRLRFIRSNNGFYVGREFKSFNDANAFMTRKIQSGDAFALIRPGFDELNTVCLWDEHEWIGTKRYTKMSTADTLINDDMKIKQWVERYKKSIANADIIGVARSEIMGEYLWRSYSTKETIYCDMECVNGAGIMLFEQPWTLALEGKKVLIVSMFVDTMKLQYERLKDVWGKKKVLPQMDVIWMKSVYYNPDTDNEGMGDLFGVLDTMKEQIAKLDFDVALLCCSFFGTFLTGEIKKMGKQAIQMGGDMQLLFGIKGGRWDSQESVTQYYNEYWVRPSEQERPQNYETIESACYW